MRNSTKIFLGSLLLAGAIPLTARAAIHQQSYDIRCQQFFSATEKLEGGLSKRPQFISAKQTLEELALADQYPSYPADQAAILKKALASKGGEDEVAGLLAVRPACDPAHYFAWSTRLIRSAKAYRLNQAERNRLASVLMTHFRSNALEPRPVLQELLDAKLLRFAAESQILKLSSPQKLLLHEKAPQIEKLSQQILSREAEIEKLKARIGEPADSAVEKERRRQLARFDWDQLLKSEELRKIIQQILDVIDDV